MVSAVGAAAERRRVLRACGRVLGRVEQLVELHRSGASGLWRREHHDRGEHDDAEGRSPAPATAGRAPPSPASVRSGRDGFAGAGREQRELDRRPASAASGLLPRAGLGTVLAA